MRWQILSVMAASWLGVLAEAPAADRNEALGQAFSLPGLFASEIRNSSPGEAGARWLWPKDPSRPGQELTPLSARVSEAVFQEPTPLGVMSLQRIQWSSASGAPVAETRVLSSADGTELILETEFKQGPNGRTGDFNRVAFAAPALTPPASFHRVWTFAMEPFSPPTRKAIPTSGPVVLYNDQLEVMVVSPLDHFLVSLQVPEKGEWLCGFEGELEQIPAGTVHRVLIVQGRGLVQTVLHWGELVQAWHGRKRPASDADVGLQYLGYWTDNGAYYYYHTEPGMNYHETLMAVRNDALQRRIPYGYFQIDSWWYPKAEGKGLISAARGGALVWEPMASMFPHGLPAFQQELGLPLVAHNRWYDRNSPYCQRYECAFGEGDRNAALPVEPEFWDEIMANALRYGVQVYEQDWLDTQWDMIPWLRSGLDHAERWFDSMVQSADRHGLTMQLCMASPGFFLAQVKHPNVTQVRASNDYIAGLPKRLYWPDFHQVSLFAYAVGLWPFKDNFQSASGQRRLRNERWPFEEALISTLSAGPVGPSDRIGAADRELLLRTCRSDGLLLKPDHPAFPIDLMFLDSGKPWIVMTKSQHELGDTYYLLAYRVLGQPPRERSVSFAELGLQGRWAVYNYRAGKLEPPSDRIDFGRLGLNDGAYYVLCPVLENGAALIGETGKFITLSRKRFSSVRFAAGRLELLMEGVPGEETAVMIFSPVPPRPEVDQAPVAVDRLEERLYSVAVRFPEAGRVRMEIQFSTE